MLSTYLTYQFYAQNLAQSQKRVAAEPQVANATAYYEANIGKVTSVSDFVNNYRLFSYAMKAYGLEDEVNNKGFMTKVLESDLSNSSSFVNTLNDPRYKQFAQAYSFLSSGALPNSSVLQSSDQEQDTTGLYSTAINTLSSNAAAATTYYQDNIGSVKSISDLISNTKLYDYVLKAYNIDPTTTPVSQITAALESNPSDPKSFAALSGNTAFQALAGAFNFQSDGTVSSTTALQTSTQQSSTTSAYNGQVSLAVSDISSATTYYQNNIGSIKSVHDLESNAQLYNYVLQAYGIDPTTTAQATITSVLESDLSNSKSFANMPGARTYSAATGTFTQAGPNAAYQSLASDFNFDTSGKVTDQRIAQSAPASREAIAAYNLTVTSDPTAQANAKTATTYYQNTIGKVTSLSGLLGDSKLISYIATAYGLPAADANATKIGQILTSDLANPASVANQLGTAAQNLAAAFNFGTDGSIDRAPVQEAQTSKTAIITTDRYLEQSLEDEAGQQSPAVQDALYFARLAPTITNPYVILSDKTLLSVVQTALGIPTGSSSQDIDVQAATITSQLNLKDLQDPTKLNAFIQRYILQYDIANPGGTTPDLRGTLASLFGSTPVTTTVGLFSNPSSSTATSTSLLL
jgi:hypothetical protein